MSGLTTGLTIGFAFAGAAAGFGLHFLSSFASIFSKGSHKTAGVGTYIAVSTAVGAAIGFSGGWLFDGGASKIYNGVTGAISGKTTDSTLTKCVDDKTGQYSFAYDDNNKLICVRIPQPK